MKRSIALALVAATSVAGLSSAALANDSADRVETGILTCKLADQSNYVVYSTEDFDCSFDPSGDVRPTEQFKATIKAVGIDLSYAKEKSLVWAVMAPTGVDRMSGVLDGSYGGASADVAAYYGGGVNVLVGGSNNQIALQPLAVQGSSKAAGVAVTIDAMEISSATPAK